MTQFLLETLLWTGVLIAAVLVLRRPVARIFGPQAAYALWALPLLRLMLPPITLPSWMAPEPTASERGVLIVEETFIAAPTLVEQTAAAAPATIASSVDFVLPLVMIWLAGAAVFAGRRFALYFAMRREMLDGAIPVGETGDVRMVESPATKGPLAFGVRDKVIALPMGFMARRDRQTRDLAIAHELAHHRGHDLLVNFLVQPLFALHWFNPLGWAGWRALRRDQEAACDARVVANRSRDERAHYADIIAGFATTAGAAPARALAAPMACPVLGDKSIIHRLRSLTMSDISPRRRFAGRAVLAAGALALPLTASISYAAVDSPDFPAPPAPPAAPGAPLPALAPQAPDAPTPPTPGTAEDREVEIERAIEQAERELERAEKELESGEKTRVVRIVRDKDGDKEEEIVHRVVRVRDGEKMTDEEREQVRTAMSEVRKSLAEGGELRRQMRFAFAQADLNREGATRITVDCSDGSEGKAWTDDQGNVVTRFCKADVLASALSGLMAAREAMAKSEVLDGQARNEALKSIDAAIAEMRLGK